MTEFLSGLPFGLLQPLADGSFGAAEIIAGFWTVLLALGLWDPRP